MMVRNLAAIFLCLAGLTFPFSVAATNIALAIALALGLIGGAWWRGARRLWDEQRGLAYALLAYLGLVVVGLLWSLDKAWGLHVLGRHWFWMLLPAVFSIFEDRQWRVRFMFFLSAGLALHLGFCVLQKYGLVAGTTAGGSDVHDATGHIGHIGFGFVYGVWAAWLLHWGWLRQKWQRYVAWLLAGWSWVMVFLALGRSGYLIALFLFAVVIWKHLVLRSSQRKTLLIFGVLAITLVVVASGSTAKQRLEHTLQGLQALYNHEMRRAVNLDERWGLWLIGLEVWEKHPLLGVGTGGYPAVAEQIGKAKPDLVLGSGIRPAHPHSLYLQALARWGVLGLFTLLWLLFVWIRLGWRQDWLRAPTAPLIALSGMALAIHGLSSSSLEEHFSAVYAVLLLSLALAELAKPATQD